MLGNCAYTFQPYADFDYLFIYLPPIERTSPITGGLNNLVQNLNAVQNET